MYTTAAPADPAPVRAACCLDLVLLLAAGLSRRSDRKNHGSGRAFLRGSESSDRVLG
jgi:hypothetical protein